MKTPDDVVKAVATRLSDTWHLTVLAEFCVRPPPPVPDPPAPHRDQHRHEHG